MVIGRGFRVEVYERSDDSEWEGTFGSPGNLSCIEEYVFDPNGFDSSIPSCRVLVLNFVSKTSYGLAVVDGETREAQFATLEDDERFSQLEAVIVQAQVKLGSKFTVLNLTGSYSLPILPNLLRRK